MTSITEDLDLPAGTNPARVTVAITLAGTGGKPLAAGYTPDQTLVGKIALSPDPDGHWEADLTPNDQITPAGTVYRILLGGGTVDKKPRYITVPDNPGSLKVRDLLTDPPAALEPTALAAHAAKRGAGGHLPDNPDDNDIPYWDADTGTWVAAPPSGGLGGGVTDHGDLDGLNDNDHPQYQLAIDKGQANGYASLDDDGLIPAGQIPDSIARDSEVAGLISAAIDELLDDAPGALNTLNKLAAAINDDASFAASVTAALAGKQDLNANLTAIASLATTGFGRSLLELASSTAGRAALGLIIGTDVQAHDGDLDAIAAISTATFGRSLLTLVNAAALTAALDAATDAAAGKVELATIAETTTGTDATRAVTPDGLAGSAFGKRIIAVQVTDPNGASIVNGNGQAFLRIPALLNGWSLDAVGAAVTSVSSIGLPTVQLVNLRAGAGTPNMLSTSLTIDANEKDSATAAIAAVISAGTTSTVPDKQVATGDQIRVDLSGGPTGAKGLIVQLTFVAP